MLTYRFTLKIDLVFLTSHSNIRLSSVTPPCGRRVSTQFLVFSISTRVDITVYQRKMFYIS